jgi:hypothetical protein
MMFGAAMLAACGSVEGGANEAQARGSTGTSRKLDVAGVRPGMSAAEARTTLERQGWRIEAVRGQSWEEMIAYEAERKRNGHPDFSRRSGIEALNATKGDENLEVKMHPVPGGATVSVVNYTSPLAGRSQDQLRAEMISRYGNPDRSSPAGAPIDMSYCTGDVRCTNAFGSEKTALGVGVQSGVNLRINLLEGSEAERAWRASLDRAVLAKTGGGGKSF